MHRTIVNGQTTLNTNRSRLQDTGYIEAFGARKGNVKLDVSFNGHKFVQFADPPYDVFSRGFRLM